MRMFWFEIIFLKHEVISTTEGDLLTNFKSIVNEYQTHTINLNLLIIFLVHPKNHLLPLQNKYIIAGIRKMQ